MATLGMRGSYTETVSVEAANEVIRINEELRRVAAESREELRDLREDLRDTRRERGVALGAFDRIGSWTGFGTAIGSVVGLAAAIANPTLSIVVAVGRAGMMVIGGIAGGFSGSIAANMVGRVEIDSMNKIDKK